MKTILSVVGARPNFMKVAPLHRVFARYAGQFRSVIVHTGQHYDEKMSRAFFVDLELPEPDVYLGVGSGSHAEQTARVMTSFEKVVEEQKPHLVVVVGDVNSTIACSLVAAKMGVPVAHVEAGLRSFDRTMPEELNRLVTDALSDFLFVTERSGVENLRREGIPEKKVHFVGNTMIDSLVQYREKAAHSDILSRLSLRPGAFMITTLHRPSNVDERRSLENIVSFFERFVDRMAIVFPVHPRTRKKLIDFGLLDRLTSLKEFRLIEPLGYLEFLHLLERAKLVLTDSGGIQEETTFLGVPCVTLRDNTERPVTVEEGTNFLAGAQIEKASPIVEAILDGKTKKGTVPELWDGKAAERIGTIILSHVGSK